MTNRFGNLGNNRFSEKLFADKLYKIPRELINILLIIHLSHKES